MSTSLCGGLREDFVCVEVEDNGQRMIVNALSNIWIATEAPVRSNKTIPML
jgi:hypothetical protein